MFKGYIQSKQIKFTGQPKRNVSNTGYNRRKCTASLCQRMLKPDQYEQKCGTQTNTCLKPSKSQRVTAGNGH